MSLFALTQPAETDALPSFVSMGLSAGIDCGGDENSWPRAVFFSLQVLIPWRVTKPVGGCGNLSNPPLKKNSSSLTYLTQGSMGQHKPLVLVLEGYKHKACLHCTKL